MHRSQEYFAPPNGVAMHGCNSSARRWIAVVCSIIFLAATTCAQQNDRIGTLIRALADSDGYAVGEAARQLSELGESSVPALSAAFRDANPGVRFAAGIALYRMGNGAVNAITALVDGLKDSTENVRWVSAAALGNLGRAAGHAVPALLKSLSDRDPDVRAAAGSALDRIAPDRPPTDLTTASAVIDTLVPELMEELHVPGVAVVLIHDHKLRWSRNFGFADPAKRIPVDSNTLFEACSMSKPVFAYIVMKLVEEGKLGLDVPLVRYLTKQPVDAGLAPITARMALSHTSGLPNWRKGDEERDGPLTLKFVPGSRFSYSGEGIFYLQRVVEEITGESLDALSSRMLFGPMGLTNCSYISTNALAAHIASGHDGQGKFRQKTAYTHPNAAYSMYVSAENYAKLILLMMNRPGDPYTIPTRFVDTMLSHQVQLDSRDPIERPGKARGLAAYWGLGWSLNSTAMGDIAHHGGSNGSGFRCFSQFNRVRGTGIVIMTNGMGGTDLWTRVISRVGDL
jgi:CubicO group peptidase (beta-lactamase class C family)